MGQMAFVSAWTAALAVVGYHLGAAVHGPSVQALVCATAGGAGGFGIGCSGLDVLRRWRVASARAADPAPERPA
jgi:hypothetical protein